jgi:hypothetical protein
VSCIERKLKLRLCTTIVQNSISNATSIFILCERDHPNLHFSPTHPLGNIADWLTRFHMGCLSALKIWTSIEQVNLMHSRLGKCIKIKTTVYSVSFAISYGCSVFRREVVCFLRLPWVYQSYQLNDMNLSLGNLLAVGLEQTFTNSSLSRTLWPRCQ